VSWQKNNKKTVKKSIIFSLLLSISIIIIILYFTINETTISYFRNTPIRYEFFILAGLVNIVFWFIWGARVKILSSAIDTSFHIGLWDATKIVIANLFLANITPSMAGGEPVRIYLLNKEGLPIGCATAATLGERLLDALFLLLCVPFAFFIYGRYIQNPYLQIGLYFAVGIFIVIVLLFVYAMGRPEKIKSLLIRIAKWMQRFSRKKQHQTHIIERISEEVDHFHESMVFFITKGKKTFFMAFLITAVFWITGWIIPILLLIGLGVHPFIIESCAAQVLLVLIAMMPTTPGSAGISEGGVAALYGVFLNSYLIGVFVLLFRLITYHMGLIAGAIFQYRIFKSITSFSTDMVSNEDESR